MGLKRHCGERGRAGLLLAGCGWQAGLYIATLRRLLPTAR